MKRKLIGLILSLVTTCGLVTFAQDNTPPAPALIPIAMPAEGPALGPVDSPTAAAAEAAPAAAPSVPAPAPAAVVRPATTASAPAPAAVPVVVEPGEIIPLIQIEDVPLTDAIRNLARQSNLNFQFDPRVMTTNQPNVSIRFEKVTAQEALLAVLDNYNLVLAQDNKSKIARITQKDPKAEDPLVSKIIQLMYSDPTNVVQMVTPILSQRSRVIGDARTRQMIVTTTEKEMDAVIALVAKLDTATRQVLIEAHIFETARNPSTIKGIDWTGTLEAQHFEFGNNTPDLLEPTRTEGPVLGRVFDGAPRLAMNTKNGFYPPIGFLNADGISGVLSFLNKDTESEVVATPRAVTLDNQTATLSITRAFPIFLVTPGSANTAAGSSVNYTNVGTILTVTPRIAADKNITLKVVPEVSNVDGVDKQVINDTVSQANIYAVRRIETSVIIPSGNTLVMGGLISDTKTKGYTKVPVLGDIPVFNLLFRKESTDRKKSNLLIFITPTIVDESAYQMTSSGTEFLKSRQVERTETELSAWDSAKPHDWTKPVY
jgi:type II secretory pathway component GspD/PulD (secretin)